MNDFVKFFVTNVFLILESAKKVIEEVLSWDNTNDYLVVNGGMSKRTLFFREEQRNLMEIEIFIVVDQSLYLKFVFELSFDTLYTTRHYFKASDIYSQL